MTTISTPQYLLDQAKRRFTPTVNTIPGMGLIEKRLLNVDWAPRALAEPPAGSTNSPSTVNSRPRALSAPAACRRDSAGVVIPKCYRLLTVMQS